MDEKEVVIFDSGDNHSPTDFINFAERMKFCMEIESTDESKYKQLLKFSLVKMIETEIQVLNEIAEEFPSLSEYIEKAFLKLEKFTDGLRKSALKRIKETKQLNMAVTSIYDGLTLTDSLNMLIQVVVKHLPKNTRLRLVYRRIHLIQTNLNSLKTHKAFKSKKMHKQIDRLMDFG